MIQQKVCPSPTTPKQGVLIVAGILGTLLVASLLTNVIALYSDSFIPTLAVWLAAIGAAVYVMRERVMEYCYTVSDGRLTLERVFGQHTKVLLHVPLSDITEFGGEAELRARHPQIKNAMVLAMKSCALERMAIAYKQDGQLQMAIFQPDEQMKKAVWDEEARERARQEKWPGP